MITSEGFTGAASNEECPLLSSGCGVNGWNVSLRLWVVLLVGWQPVFYRDVPSSHMPYRI